MEQPTRRIPIGVAAGLSALILTTGGATAWWTWNTVIDSKKDTTPTAIQPSPPPEPVRPSAEVAPPVAPPATAPSTSQPVQPSQQQDTMSPAKTTIQVYWLKDTGSNLELAPSQVTVDASVNRPNIVLERAFNGLLAGPTNSNVTTTIPEGTKLQSVAIQNNGIHVNLSQEFTAGGGSASMIGRVAQVLYTATSLEPGAKVWIAVEGQPLEVLGGEGLELAQPLTRQSFKNDFRL